MSHSDKSMIEIKDLIKAELIEKFSERVAFNKIERILYSSDLGSLPAVVTNRIHTVPDAVVQPRDNSELISLTDLASRNNIPLVPRGGGSAGYGGAVPTKRGIVVDFSRMNKIIKIDNENKIVTIEAGVILAAAHVELSPTCDFIAL